MRYWGQQVVAGMVARAWKHPVGEGGEVVQATERKVGPEQLMLAILLGQPDPRQWAQSWRTLRNAALVIGGLVMLLLTTRVGLGDKGSQLQAEQSLKPIGSPEVTGMDQGDKIRELLVPMAMHTLPRQPLNGGDPVHLSRRMSPPGPRLSARKKPSPRASPGKPSHVERSGAPDRSELRPYDRKGGSRAGVGANRWESPRTR